MSRNHPPTPSLHLFRRASSPANNISLAPLVNYKGTAAAVAGLGMGLGTAVGAGFKADLTSTAMWSRPFMHLASTAAATSSAVSTTTTTPISYLPTPIIGLRSLPPPAILRNRVSITPQPTAPIPLHRRRGAPSSSSSSLSPSDGGNQGFLGYGYGAGYEQHQTGLSLPSLPTADSELQYSTAAAAANVFGSLIRGPPPVPLDTQVPPPASVNGKAKRRHHRVWNLRPAGLTASEASRREKRAETESWLSEGRSKESDNNAVGSKMLLAESAGQGSLLFPASSRVRSATTMTPSSHTSTLAQATPLPSTPTPQNTSQKPPTTPETKKSHSSPTSPSHIVTPHLTLSSSASGIPKQRHQTPPPRPPVSTDPLTKTTAVQVGEDAYFLRDDSLGISDGVGGWSSARRKRQQRRIKFDNDGEDGTPGRRGGEEWVEAEGDADPGRFSRLLMHFCEREVDAWRARAASTREGAANRQLDRKRGEGRPDEIVGKDGIKESVENDDMSDVAAGDKNASENGEVKPLDPVEVMQKGYEKCLECVQSEGIFGSATCLVATLTENTLRVANLGDCAIVVVRKGDIVFRTEEMQHSFNFPLQLGTNSRDEPMKDAEYFEVQVEEGDIVVMCSDGLSDNLFDEDIFDIIASHPSPPRPSTLADALCKAAQEASEETGSASPFMCRAIEEGLDFMGGKKDDISVLVAVVRDSEEEV